MGSHREYNKGYQSGRGFGRPRIPTNFAESVGYNAGRAQREREMGARHDGELSPSESVGSGSRVVYFLLILAGLLTLGMLLILIGPHLIKLLYPGVAIFGLIKLRSVKRRLGVFTPIYLGALIGMLLGCFELAISSSQLNLNNLLIFLFAGGMIGSIGVPISLARSTKSTQNEIPRPDREHTNQSGA
jgi:hypothetical protein